MHFSHQHTHASALLTLNDTFYPTVTFHVATLSFFIAPHTRFSLAIEKTECSHGFPGIRVSLHFRSMSPNRNLSTYYWVFKKYLFIWLCQVVVAALEIFSLQSSIWDLSVASMQTLSCDMWDLVSWPGIEPRSPALGAQNLCHWTTREVPLSQCLEKTHTHSHVEKVVRRGWREEQISVYVLPLIRENDPTKNF